MIEVDIFQSTDQRLMQTTSVWHESHYEKWEQICRGTLTHPSEKAKTKLSHEINGCRELKILVRLYHASQHKRNHQKPS